jgi:nitroimidazol reductase NimA-like FMN-containing flavoprotein (pyridoxamine 5'-phosphate oxidase superfamily)
MSKVQENGKVNMAARTSDERSASARAAGGGHPDDYDRGERLDGDGPEDLDGAGLEVLDRAACLGLLARGGVGRIAVNAGALPKILPVRFALDAEQLVMCVGIGSTLDRATLDTVVAFEADGFEPGAAGEWSVSVVGVARHLSDGADTARAEALPLPRWWLDRPPRFVTVSTEHMSGRRAPGWP